MFIFTSSLRDFRLLSAKFRSVQQSLNLRCDRKTHAKRRKTASQSYARVFIILFSAWRKEKAINKSLNEFTKEELVNILRSFYVEARSYDGKYYSRNSMKAIRAGLDRYLNKENTNFSIITDRDFKPANEALNAHLVELAREGKFFIHETQTSADSPRRRNSLREEAARARNTGKFAANSLV